ncbi:hypothetical protein [Actinoplanes sp. CA-252034]|uniref:hypothetical protein n=1 Tax=Actinoplanes sp. CA-252034 TaxID=3239906 RepID=UPI003D966A76
MVSGRLRGYVHQHFASDEIEPILSLLAEVVHSESDDPVEGIERIQAAVLLVADGDSHRFLQALAMAQRDWRDVLVAADLAHENWPDRLQVALS